MIDLKKKIQEEGQIKKFDGVAPEGFILLHENALEDLMNFDVWKQLKKGKLKIKDLNNKYLNVKQ